MLVLATSIAVRAETDAEVQARKDALDVAGAFANDGFKIRDGHWCGIDQAARARPGRGKSLRRKPILVFRCAAEPARKLPSASMTRRESK